MNRIKQHLPFLSVLTVVATLFLLRLGRDMLWDWDECLYGQYAKEMLRTGHYLTNIWNGYIDLQKPPLFSWILMIPTVFHQHEFGLRLVNVVMSVGLLSSVYFFAKQFFNRSVAILSTLILVTAEVFVIYSLKLSTDMTYTLFLFLGVWTWLSNKRQSPWFAGILFGLAAMTKGIGAIQFLGALFISLFLNYRKERLLNFLKMCTIAALIALPWHLTAYLEYGSRFVKVYFLDNIIKRSRYPIEFHRERVWFYGVLIYRELMPWLAASVVFPISTLMSFSRKRESRDGSPIKLGMRLQSHLKNNETIYTILLLVIIPFIGITRVQTRIAWYILPLYPFLSIYLAYCIYLLIDVFAKKNTNIRALLFSLVVLFITFDAGKLILNETRFSQVTQSIDTRQEVALQVVRQPQRHLTYLVPFGERQAKVILPPEETIDMTWVYGGNGCMVYYGDKKTDYVYEVPRFERLLKTQQGLFLISTQDAQYAVGKKIIFQNTDFILFTL